ncbi:MAG: carboxypeptidase-like regulatory domain-containing protein, partial [bacterium]
MNGTIFFILLTCICHNLSGKTYRVYGTIQDEITGEVLIGANVYDTISGKGTVSSKNGFYSLELNSEEAVLIYSYVGYEDFILKLKGTHDTLINIPLTPGSELGEVTITGAPDLSIYNISSEQILSTPALGGEPDLMKYLQLLPGIQPGKEGSGNIHVRGGGPGDNIVLLDRVPLYYVNHLGGFVSIF